MRTKAREELDEWMGERSRRQRERTGGSREPRLAMSVVTQSKASFSDGKAGGIDGISAEILQSIPWRALQKIKKAFEMRFIGRNNEDIETWLRNIIVLSPKEKTTDRLDRREESVRRVYWKWKKGQELGRHPYFFGFEEGRSATEIFTAIRLMAAVAREW